MILLALDLGTTTGFAYGDHRNMVSGTWGLKPSRYDGGGMRFVKFRGKLNELHNVEKIEQVAYEEVRRHVATDAAHVYGGLMAMLTSWCEEHSIPYEGIPVGSIKKFAVGRGNASKPAVFAKVRSWGFAPEDDNEADAIALFRFKLIGDMQ